MTLVTSNSQGELSPLEIGLHALRCVESAQGRRGKGLAAYAEAVGRAKSTLSEMVSGARVAATCSVDRTSLQDKTAHLSAIHALPSDCWPGAVQAMLDRGWSAKETAERVKAANVGRIFARPLAVNRWQFVKIAHLGPWRSLTPPV